jgi:hypothetical protein
MGTQYLTPHGAPKSTRVYSLMLPADVEIVNPGLQCSLGDPLRMLDGTRCNNHDFGESQCRQQRVPARRIGQSPGEAFRAQLGIEAFSGSHRTLNATAGQGDLKIAGGRQQAGHRQSRVAIPAEE